MIISEKEEVEEATESWRRDRVGQTESEATARNLNTRNSTREAAGNRERERERERKR